METFYQERQTERDGGVGETQIQGRYENRVKDREEWGRKQES